MAKLSNCSQNLKDLNCSSPFSFPAGLLTQWVYPQSENSIKLLLISCFDPCLFPRVHLEVRIITSPPGKMPCPQGKN